MNDLNKKERLLRRRFRELESAVVAFSGGVDSAVLTKVAHEELGESMIAVTAISPSVPQNDSEIASNFCTLHGIPHQTVVTEEFSDERYVKNPADRCYYCKSALYNSLIGTAEKMLFNVVAEGTNASDLSGHRPGNRASEERNNVVTPLIECGFTKKDVRALARNLGLGDIAEKPATACLSSRIPTGFHLDPEVLGRVDMAEEVLRSLGIFKVRVRHHGEIARIEVAEADMETALKNRDKICDSLKTLGYRYITLDLNGYRPAVPEDK
jgi:uncharacterized protein